VKLLEKPEEGAEKYNEKLK